jgi:hypothetical protein
MLSNPKTTLAGYVALLSFAAAFLAGIGAVCGLPFCLQIAAFGISLGGAANALGNIMARDGGH